LQDKLSRENTTVESDSAATLKPEETANLERLDELARPRETTPPDDKPAEAAKAVELEKANEKLSSLLGRPK
jgi:hypothetical protein